MPIRNLQILILALIVCGACYYQAERSRYGGRIGAAIELIENNYVEPVDSDKLYHGAMNGLVSQLDQFSEFIPPSKYEEFQSVIEQKFGGLGILVEGPPAVRQLTVVAPIPGTPAFAAGLQPGDFIQAIDGVATNEMLASDATKLMRGPLGKPVTLTLRRDGLAANFDVKITRADIPIDSVFGDRIQADSYWNFFLEEDPRIAYIRVTLFGEKTDQEFAAALEKVKGSASAIIIDLRYNPGGILKTAVDMCDMLVSQGVIVSTRGRNGQTDTIAKASPGTVISEDIPMVVMVNDQSASASEIMAGCLQDLGRAEIAGSRSYGKGTVQRIFELGNDQTALKFTTARFYRPSGMNIHRSKSMSIDDEWGIRPSPELELKLSDLHDLFLARRWQLRSDPRLTNTVERPPAPPCAADPQLLLVLEHLQFQLQAKAE
ncbi:MAG: S41 family peptidase [Planctomycetales bacterium]|nr:S41 family peptidase [Planctomycetales bacterium]